MNEGALRPVTVTAPEGSFLNPRPPAGGGPRAIICYRTFEAVLGALAPALPERVAAAASHMANPTFGGWDRARRRRFVAYELVLSGTGRPRRPRTAARRCRGRSTPRTSRSRRRRPASRSSSSASSCIRDSARRRPVPRRLRHPPRPALPRRRGQADEPLRAPALRALRALRRRAGPARPHRASTPGPGEQTVHGKQSREFAYGDVDLLPAVRAPAATATRSSAIPPACWRTCSTTTCRSRPPAPSTAS